MGMLILTRRIGETLVIDDNTRLTVLGVKGNQVRIGITAPKEVTVDREEIYLRKKLGMPMPKKGPQREENCAYVKNNFSQLK